MPGEGTHQLSVQAGPGAWITTVPVSLVMTYPDQT